jgi:hypothetical protein
MYNTSPLLHFVCKGPSHEDVTAFFGGWEGCVGGKLAFFFRYNAALGALSDWLRGGRLGDQVSVSEILIFPVVPSLDRGQISFIPMGTIRDIGTKS